MAFDLTFNQKDSQDFIHPELTSSSISVDLTFSRALADKVEMFLLDEWNPTFLHHFRPKNNKNALITYPGHD